MSTPTLGRREKLGSSVRTALNEQLGRVQIKHLAEIEVLDDMRNFLKQRAQIEREYSQNIQKLCQQYSSRREVRSPPELKNFSRRENRGIMEMWKFTLEKTDELGKGRGSVADMLQNRIAETLKEIKRRKELQFKKYYEVAQRMVSEVLDTIRGLTTTKKLYRERWKMSEEARAKFNDADGRLRNSQLKLFETKTALERTQKKCSERLISAQKHSTAARNEYLLALEVTNAHLRKHFETDIPEIMKEVDGDMYDKVQEAYLLYAQIEADNANTVKAEFEDLRDQAALVNRDYVVACFVHEHPIFSENIVYQFEPSAGDKVTAISKEHESDLYLEREARKWSQDLTKLNHSIVDKNKAVKGLQSVAQAYQTTPEFGTTDATAEAQQNLFEILEELRQISVQTNKINTSLDLLRNSGIDVEKWLQQAAQSNGDHRPHQQDKQQSQQQADLLDLTKSLKPSQNLSNSQLSLTEGDTTSLRSADVMSVGSNFSEPYNPALCVVLYSYQSQRTDELDIFSDDELEVLEWDDGDGWCKGRNKSGVEGYFPQSYVKAVSRPPSPSASDVSSTRRTSSLVSDAISMDPKKTSLAGTEVVKADVMLRALFEYNGQDEEELSFPEGAKIKLLRTDDNGVDDGWWEGCFEGKTGVFPSVVVEMLSSDSNQDLTPSNSEIFPSEPLTPPPVPPPPTYPAPEISVWDLTIGPNIKPKSNPSSNRPSPSSSRAGTSSAPANVKHSPPSRETTLLDQSIDLQDSFEDTLCDQQQNNWSSFEDVQDDDDVSYV